MSLPVQRSALPTRYRRNMGQLLSHPSGTVYLDLAGLPENTTRPLVEMTIPTVSGPEVISGYDSIFHLPANAVANGQISASLAGQTVTNFVQNGNFADGTTGWSGVNATLSASNGVLSISGSISSFASQQTNILPTTNRKIFAKMRAKANNANCVGIRISVNGGVTQNIVTISDPIQNQWYSIFGVVTISGQTSNLQFRLNHDYIGSQADRVMEVKEVFAVDMGTDSSNPLYNLTVDQMNARFPHWFGGTKSTVNDARVSSSDNEYYLNGRELKKWTGGFAEGTGNARKDLENLYLDAGIGVATSSTRTFVTDVPIDLTNVDTLYIDWEVEVGVQGAGNNHFSLVVSGDKMGMHSTYDARLFRNTSFNRTIETLNVSSLLGAYYLRIHARGTSAVENNTVGKVYSLVGTPLNKSQKFISAPGVSRSLPNGTKDEVSDGKHIKRISEPLILQTSSITNFQTDFTNFDRVAIHYPTLTGWAVPDIQGWSNDTVTGKVLISGFTEKARVDSVENVNTFFTNSNGNIGLCLPKGLYADLAQAQSALAGTTLNYQLAEEIETELTPVVREERVLPNRRI